MTAKNILIAIGFGALLMQSPGWAQGRYRDDSRYSRNRGGYYGADVVSRVKRDVQAMARAASPRVDGEKRDLFRDTIYNLERFEYNGRRGKFDKDRLDGAIDEMKRLVGSNQISRQMKSALARNIDALRNLRDGRGGSYGYYGNRDRRW
ncbi:MAG: hypothetical protein KJZ78_06050 [Bryobacteraceae bacterium]|nr:hypothetical protein [Bryobacteraceae bacterium]HEU0142972.1 hypothetical protein [Bryobacteraceae bacterium]